MLDDVIAAQRTVDVGEASGAEDDEENHRHRARRRVAHALQHREVEPTGHHREHDGAEGPPTAPASLGVAQPNRIDPLIIEINSTGGRKALRVSDPA